VTRILVVVFCYFLSCIGIALSSTLMGAHPVMYFVVPYAWVIHAVMCVTWIRGVPLHKAWWISGTLAGLACLAIAPIGFVLVFPCVLLAIHIIRYQFTYTERVGNHVSL
jgi:hypothetical protein